MTYSTDTNMVQHNTGREKPRQAQSVNFSPVVKVHAVHKNTEEESQSVWYTDEEYATIQINILKTVKRIRKGKVDEDRYCTRGLEHVKTPSRLEQREANKQALRRSILSEQRKQLKTGFRDPENICMISVAFSRESIEAAIRQGASDTTAVQDIKSDNIKDKENNQHLRAIENITKQAVSTEIQGKEEEVESSPSIQEESSWSRKKIKKDNSQPQVSNTAYLQASILSRIVAQVTTHLQPETEQTKVLVQG